jgi:hypothetical protein
MRQSLSVKARPHVAAVEQLAGRSPAAVRLVIGAVALSATLAVAALVDQMGAQTLIEHTTSIYASHTEEPGAGLVYGLLYGVAGLGVLLWTGVLQAARRFPRVGAAMSGVATVVMATLAVVLLASNEYGQRVYPPVWGLVALLAPLAGALATVRLLSRGRAR